MKKILLITVIVFLTITTGYSQKGSRAKPSQSSSSSTPTGSGSTELVQGYHYMLPPMYHIKYRQIKREEAKYSAISATGTPKIFSDYILSYKSALIPGSLKKYYGLKHKRFSLKDSPAGSIYVGSYLISNIRTGVHSTLTDTIHKHYYLDTISRYSSSSLRVSVTQGDSGKLIVQFLKRIETKRVDVTNVENDTLCGINFVSYEDGIINAAIPIMQDDSTQNFFLQVKNKPQVKSPLYFISLRYSVTQYGVTTIPFRYRFAVRNKKISLPDANKKQTDYSVPSEATANISLAAYIGRKFGRTRFYYDATKSHNILSFMISAIGGPTIISLNANNITSGSDINKYPSQIIAGSLGGALTCEFGALNVGLFTGVDLPLQNCPWVYKGQIWIGLGIGFNIGMFTSAGDIGL